MASSPLKTSSASGANVNTSASALQRKIFSRWVNQKLIKRHIRIEDVVKELDASTLVALIEELSEKKFAGKIDKNAKMKPQKIDNLNQALKFTFEQGGVEMKLKPSAESIFDGNEQAVLGLIWAIMSKYIKIGDEDEGAQLSAKDALLLWAQNKVQGYNDVKIEKFGKDWHDGLAFAALLHKQVPKLIDFNSLKKEDKLKNLAAAQDAAEKYFGLEKYLTPEEITKLDENAMLVYVSEYYYGMAEQRKIELAAKRISKVIRLTIENDAMKKEYNQTAQQFLERLKRVEKVLEDRAIENTMAGAKRKIAEFYDYKTNDKNVLLGNQLDLEGVYNNLAMKLSHHKRPEFVPDSGLTLKDVSKAIIHLEECEQERKVALHNELNRQILLVNLHDQHKAILSQLKAWYDAKKAYLNTEEEILSVSAAELQLKLLEAYDREAAGVSNTSLTKLKSLSVRLNDEIYEFRADVSAGTETVISGFLELSNLSANKRPVLDDALLRERFKEKVRYMAQDHLTDYNKLLVWVNEKEAYLRNNEEIRSVGEARTQLSLLEIYEAEKKAITTSSVAELRSLGNQILNSKFSTKYSNWSIEQPEEIGLREKSVDVRWNGLSELSAEKKRILDDDLAREEYKEKIRMMVRTYKDRHARLAVWVQTSQEYLSIEEKVDSIPSARSQLSRLDGFEKEKSQMYELQVVQLSKLANEILAAKYETKYSQWKFDSEEEKPEEIRIQEANIKNKWEELAIMSSKKRVDLEADLHRELEIERLSMEFARQAAEFERWSHDTVESLNSSHTQFGFSLEEVEAYQAQNLTPSNNMINNFITEKQQEYQQTHDNLAKLYGSRKINQTMGENKFTKITLEQLGSQKTSVTDAQRARETAYNAELERQRANDALCRKFSAAVEPFVASIAMSKETISESKADLEEQLKFVQSKIADVSNEETNLKPINEMFTEIESRGITNNRYTTFTAKDVEVQFEQYKSFLSKKAKMLEEEIEHTKLRGVTQEQFNEIEKTFKRFDSDNSGNIDKKELKVCLYSLGEEKSRTEVDQIMKTYGDGTQMSYNQFKEFMINLLGVSDTKDDILGSFKLINKGDETAKVEKMDLLMEDNDIEYFKKTAKPAEANTYDYKSWTDDVFSR